MRYVVAVLAGVWITLFGIVLVVAIAILATKTRIRRSHERDPGRDDQAHGG